MISISWIKTLKMLSHMLGQVTMKKKLLVVCYFSPKFVQWGRAADFLKREVKEIVLSNAGKKSDSFGDASIHLEPYKAFVVRL